MTFSYQAFGLGIQSDIALPGLIEANTYRDILIRVNRYKRVPKTGLGMAWEILDRELALLRVEDLGIFRLYEGCEIVIDLHPKANNYLVRAYLMGMAFAILLYQRGQVVLHASSINIGGHGVVFMGHSGEGKSSIAAALVARGHQLLADDVTAIDIAGGETSILSGFTQNNLDPRDVNASVLDRSRVSDHFDRTSEVGVPIQACSTIGRVPLKSTYVLEGTTGIENVREAERLIELLRYSFPKMTDARYYRQCAEIATRVPMHRLGRSGEGPSPEELARIVEADIERRLCTDYQQNT